jgi:riboflavin synthase
MRYLWSNVFTGLIEEIGVVARADSTARGLRVEIDASVVINDVKLGDSIAVNGVCQTIVELTDRAFAVEAMAPTLSRTTFGELAKGSRVNLERALALGARMGGHMVQGHVDGVGIVERVERHLEHVLIEIAVPEDVADVTVLHGSITVDGVSLTVNEMPAEGLVQVALIPHTWENTTFGVGTGVQVGSRVNLEGDMIGKFVVAYMKRRGANAI